MQVARIGAGGATAKVCLLEKEHVDPVLREETGRRATGDTAPDHDDVGHDFASLAPAQLTLICALC